MAKMESIIKNKKRIIIALTALCFLLCIAGIGVYTAAIPEENTIATENITTATLDSSANIIEEDIIAVAEEFSQSPDSHIENGWSCCPDTYGTYPWSSIEQALAYYHMPPESAHNCNFWYGDIHYTYYVQMDSFRIYVRLA